MASNNYSGYANANAAPNAPITYPFQALHNYQQHSHQTYSGNFVPPEHGSGYSTMSNNMYDYNAMASVAPPLPPSAPPSNQSNHKIHYSAPPNRSHPPPSAPPFSQRKDMHMRSKPPIGRSKQLYYCELCKISCSCPRAYQEHVESKKHKKREAAGKDLTKDQQPVNVGKFHCKLCDIPCTDKDAYNSHVHGAKHQKVIKLHTKLGKPIPKDEPETPPPATTNATLATTAAAVAVVAAGKKPVVGTVSAATEEDDEEDAKPVGAEYIEEIHEEGKLVQFNCKLCNCKFSDPNAKRLHLKGRRHRLQYKRKVEPSLVVGLKQTSRQKRMALLQVDMWAGLRTGVLPAGKLGRAGGQGGNGMPRFNMNNGLSAQPPAPFGRPTSGMCPESVDDLYAITRHSEIYPTEKCLQGIHEIISSTERAMRFVSDEMAGFSSAANSDMDAAAYAPNTPFQLQNERILQGVMRVGLLAKGLLLQDDSFVQLVALCAERPTLYLLERVASGLALQFQQTPRTNIYRVSVEQERGAIFVTDNQFTVQVSLTSPLFREDMDDAAPAAAGKDGSGGREFPRDAALQSLAELRRTKWFHAKAAPLPSCLLAIRLMRDLCQRSNIWAALDQWALELLVEMIMVTSRFPLSLSGCLRRTMEAIAAGLLLHGPGLPDPCEKEPRDVLCALTKQQREDITGQAQYFLRCIAFKQIHKVLGLQQMSMSKLKWRFWLTNRKRPNEADADGDEAEELTDAKLLKTSNVEE